MQYPFYTTETADEALRKFLPKTEYRDTLCADAVSCICMLVERLLTLSFPPDSCALFASRCGALSDHGLDVSLLAGAIAGRFGLSLVRTADIGLALGRLSPSCHFVLKTDRNEYLLITGCGPDGLRLLDPSLRKRKGAVRIRPQKKHNESEYCLVSRDVFLSLAGAAPVCYILSV